MTRVTNIAALLFVLMLALVACNNDSCYENGSSLPLTTFHVGSKQQSIPGLSIMGIGAPVDSLLLNNKSVDEVYLPLRANASQTRYALWRTVTIDTTHAVVRDTLDIDYEAIAYFHSIECGAMYNFDIHCVNHTHHGIDSVVVVTQLVTNATTPALRIHFTNFQQ